MTALIRNRRVSGTSRIASPSRPWWASGGAALIAVALHLLMVAPLVVGGAVRRPPPPDQPGAGASALASSAALVPAMTLVELLHTTSSEQPPLEELASVGLEPPQGALVIASPELLPAPILDEEIEDAETTEAAGDTQGHAEMFGRYLGQVSARIERAWRRPRSTIAAPHFSCQTKLEQDEGGKVLSVELRDCNGDARWQHSLVAAIERASPLPSPPVPSVFTRWLTLDFSAEPWHSGLSNAHDYEPEIRVAQSGEAATRQLVTNPNKTLPDMSQRRGHIELRIEGDTIRWTVIEEPKDEPNSRDRAR